jgi:uncharacterized protein GlcG (DUF336 family)
MFLPAILLSGVQMAVAQEGLITQTVKTLTQRAEFEAAQAAIDTCAAKNVHIHVFIVDANGNTKFFVVGDGSRYNTVESARRKAFTAAIKGKPTIQLQQEDAAASVKPIVTDPNLLNIAGGIPIRVGSEVIGAIGVGGGAPEQDNQCAQAGIDKIQRFLQ